MHVLALVFFVVLYLPFAIYDLSRNASQKSTKDTKGMEILRALCDLANFLPDRFWRR